MNKKTLMLFSVSILISACIGAFAQESEAPEAPKDSENPSVEEKNKQLAREFYEKVWFSKNTEAALELFAPEYVVHDIGDRKGVTEQAVEQKNIADFFWSNGDMSESSIDFQIAERDLVATRWQFRHKPQSIHFWLLGSTEEPNPIINVFRFKDGKIVEVWNHRHDIDNVNGSFKTIYGFALGFIPAAIVAIVFLFLWRRSSRKLRRLKESSPA
ncbi:MAG: hypothetical protein DWQ47_01120 [Acidobacteria bacterium]|nr:MAG: hypothetical protein DWQ32_11580 [Acidobacteriota bacterium]REK04102.1 MAG: hypothetical protein DWQ38_01105 [Acidobacteriota bacterium]REK15264.1 MAG: hypothetical protein DWQ43_17270 [Acidobacteriota bacterium]REK46354.1 MAG: hypothetical protein DWQ47_01120 [Acidobacteriota bacterium]